jgi:hypothetical protein
VELLARGKGQPMRCMHANYWKFCDTPLPIEDEFGGVVKLTTPIATRDDGDNTIGSDDRVRSHVAISRWREKIKHGICLSTLFWSQDVLPERGLFVGLHEALPRDWTLARCLFESRRYRWKASSHGCTLARFAAHHRVGIPPRLRAAFRRLMSGWVDMYPLDDNEGEAEGRVIQ